MGHLSAGEFQQNVRLHFQYICQMEQYFQRDGPYHIGGLNGSHMLPADADYLCQLFLGQVFALAVVSNGAAKIPIARRVVQVIFCMYHIRHPIIFYQNELQYKLCDK